VVPLVDAPAVSESDVPDASAVPDIGVLDSAVVVVEVTVVVGSADPSLVGAVVSGTEVPGVVPIALVDFGASTVEASDEVGEAAPAVAVEPPAVVCSPLVCWATAPAGWVVSVVRVPVVSVVDAPGDAEVMSGVEVADVEDVALAFVVEVPGVDVVDVAMAVPAG
jgi:hypothetical protein